MRHIPKFMKLSLAISIAASLVLAGTASAGPGTKPPKDKIKVTQKQREAAAKRAQDKGFVLEALAIPAEPGMAPRYFSHPNYANSPAPILDRDAAGNVLIGANGWPIIVGGGIKKFVDPLPWAPGGAPIPVAVNQAPAGAGYDYYEIGLVQYRHWFHRDVPGFVDSPGNAKGTLVRGYVQLGGAVPLSTEHLDGTSVPIAGHFGMSAPSYLGPIIIATKHRPIRITFRNLLPTGERGNLFVPTDVTVMGSGMGPAMNGMPEADPQNPMCGMADPVTGSFVKPAGCFTDNRATLHLHGGISPWISDGTPHQWITPAGEQPYPDGSGSVNKGVSVDYVPDMWFDSTGTLVCVGERICAGATSVSNDPGPGAQTFYYTNQQSARLMFYHDHAWGITRLNVYVGEAAGYVITDATEQKLVADGVIPSPLEAIPLVIQDRTFLPDAAQLALSDETWDTARWGGPGNLWLPHVYSPAQNPGDVEGVNQFGRWAYGPWFWPPTQNTLYGPIANAHFDPACDANVQWCEPPLMPGTPFNSMGMEAFHDTPIVNGKAYPTVTLDPKPYRLRILNAASDRFFNLSLYKADPLAPTEVQLNPAEVAAALADPTVFPTPVAGTEGPSWIQFGTEGGFLPAPVVIPPHPVTWVNDPTVFNAGNVDQHSLLLGPAERADVIVDLSQYAGQTLILYNDAPAAFPARDPRYDYYTGNGTYTDTGGAYQTQPGYGPNTRTVMQIVVSSNAPAPAYNLAALEAAFAHKADGTGVFESGQHPVIIGQAAYNSAYGTNFPNAGSRTGLAQIYDFSMDFYGVGKDPLAPTGQVELTLPFQTKAIQDEMGEAFDPEYGRMSGNLGLERPVSPGTAQMLILYPFVNPASELIDATNLPRANTTVAPISLASDGTQIWKITHNGVDTHPIHFHLFDVQLLNRVGWDGIMRRPDPNELGWKDTVRISPLEDTIVALRPAIPVFPFDLPNSIRPLNPMMPIGSTLGFRSVDKNGVGTVPIINQMTNFGWEYVWHCHILSHEEMDMMRPISVSVPPNAPTNLVGTQAGSGTNKRNVLTWTDNSLNESGFTIRRSLATGGPWTDLATVLPNVRTYTNQIGNTTAVYFYQVAAVNSVGYAATPGYSTVTTSSLSNTVQVPNVVATPPAAPTGLTATLQGGPQVLLAWTDNANNESGFVIERAVNGGAFASIATVGARTGTGGVSYTDTTVSAGNSYAYRVAAVNATGLSVYTNTASMALSAVPAAPTSVAATAALQGGKNARVTVTWADVGTETGYTIQRATDAAFTANVVTQSVGANVTTYTTGNLSRSTPYYFRVLAFNATGLSASTNATPFPIVTP